MVNFKGHMYKHLRSAGKWLARAEESFDNNRDVRGELDLILAQAELRHIQEVNRSRQWRYKYPLLRQGLAIAMAITVAVGGVGLGTYGWMQYHETAIPIPLVSQEIKTGLPLSVEPQQVATTMAGELATPKVSPAIERQDPVAPVQIHRTEPERPTEQDKIVDPGELQKIIRAAGKSLRGQ